ncbi:MAG: PKD domain-containing protein [Bacteroidetes bacterium]|nr:PKD domain-containing protein [Bacteroidota bacterium]
MLILQIKRGVCAGASISFKDVSWNGEVTSRMWSFPRGTPATDTAANPTVTYTTPGLYNVTLTVTNCSWYRHHNTCWIGRSSSNNWSE